MNVDVTQLLQAHPRALLQMLPRRASASCLWRARRLMDQPVPMSKAVPESPHSVVLADPGALLQRLQSENGKDRLALVEQLKALAQPKTLLIPQAKHWQQLLALHEQLPHQKMWMDQVLNRVKLQVATQQPLKLSPTLLAGPPGNGKSHLLHQVAEVFGVPTLEIQLGGNADNLSLIGTSRHWGSASPGKLALFMARCEVANPLILLEEVDKSGLGQHGWTLDIILMLLEPENACRFEDKFVDVPIDLSYCSFLATANQTDYLPAPLLSRFQICPVHAPKAREWPVIVQKLYQALRLRDGRAQLFAEELPLEVMEALLANCGSIRELRLRLEQGFDAALGKFDSPQALQACAGNLLPEPPEPQAANNARRMGFV
ncbi:ATPase family associated with various cellular activities (AAA) [Formivibrio citricus]|uniref:ATPase family associated with various cellular activities (AAA) n=1 Tax=Formivibrio citricus TaxID=83765 RepID=A0A1I5ATL0_9NEIS|nr:AAA family ATPase [Formivibrio citricus]SFN65764.1 ATPase family associated with various cellular activities (AAA) [Formivibrio citricus]